MILNHIDLQVPDVPATAAFFERYFGFENAGNKCSKAIAILTGAGGFTLVLQRLANDSERYPEGFHVGFLVGDVDAVLAARARIETGNEGEDATPVATSAVVTNNRGTMFYCTAPGGITVEVSCRKAREVR